MNNIQVGGTKYEWFPYSQVDNELPEDELQYDYDEGELEESKFINVCGVPIQKDGHYVLSNVGFHHQRPNLVELDEDGYWMRVYYQGMSHTAVEGRHFMPTKYQSIRIYNPFVYGGCHWDEYRKEWSDPMEL